VTQRLPIPGTTTTLLRTRKGASESTYRAGKGRSPRLVVMIVAVVAVLVRREGARFKVAGRGGDGARLGPGR
jgi:hypothetical protein